MKYRGIYSLNIIDTRDILRILLRKTKNASLPPMRRGNHSHPRVTSVTPSTFNNNVYHVFMSNFFFCPCSKTCKPHEISGNRETASHREVSGTDSFIVLMQFGLVYTGAEQAFQIDTNSTQPLAEFEPWLLLE